MPRCHHCSCHQSFSPLQLGQWYEMLSRARGRFPAFPVTPSCNTDQAVAETNFDGRQPPASSTVNQTMRHQSSSQYSEHRNENWRLSDHLEHYMARRWKVAPINSTRTPHASDRASAQDLGNWHCGADEQSIPPPLTFFHSFGLLKNKTWRCHLFQKVNTSIKWTPSITFSFSPPALLHQSFHLSSVSTWAHRHTSSEACPIIGTVSAFSSVPTSRLPVT